MRTLTAHQVALTPKSPSTKISDHKVPKVPREGYQMITGT